MDLYTSSPSNTVNNETDDSPSPSNSPFHIWQPPVLQGDYNPPMPVIHDPSQSVTPTVPQDHAVQSNVPFFPHPSISFYQRPHLQFSFQDDAGPEVHTVPQDLTSAAVSQRQIACVNASTPQPPHQVHQDTFPMQGDPSPHVPSNVVPPIQTKTPTDQKRYSCPYCKEKFKRNQELKRHLRSNLPDSIHCPFSLCPWTGRRQYNLTKHLEAHPDPGRKYGRKESQIYDPEELVRSMASGTLTVEGATDIALSKIRKRFKEKDKAGVEASVWGSRRKFCTARSPS